MATRSTSTSANGHARLVLGILTLISAAGLTVAGLLTAQVHDDLTTLRGRVVEIERRSPRIAEQLGAIHSELASIQRSLAEIKQDIREQRKEAK